MKRETVLKIILVLIIGMALFARPVSVFAVSSDPANLNDFWEDQGSLEDIEGDTTPEPEPEPEKQPEPETKPSINTNTNTSTTNKTDIPKAGLVEDTIIITSVLALIGVAVFTFVKISDYSNI